MPCMVSLSEKVFMYEWSETPMTRHHQQPHQCSDHNYMYLLLSDGRLMYKNHPRPAISYMLNELICSFDSYHICRHYKSKLDDLMRKVVVEHATFVSLSPQSWNYSLETSCCSFFPWNEYTHSITSPICGCRPNSLLRCCHVWCAGQGHQAKPSTPQISLCLLIRCLGRGVGN